MAVTKTESIATYTVTYDESSYAANLSGFGSYYPGEQVDIAVTVRSTILPIATLIVNDEEVATVRAIR